MKSYAHFCANGESLAYFIIFFQLASAYKNILFSFGRFFYAYGEFNIGSKYNQFL